MSKALRVLLVEDSEDDALLLLENLRAGGYEPASERVVTANDLRKALRNGPWDLVLADYSMPQFDAPEAIRIVREGGLGIPIIIVSGTIGEDIAVETLKMGADDYLLKHNLVRLVPAVERALTVAAGTAARKASEEKLRLTLEHLQIAVRAGKAGTWDWNMVTGEVTWDAQMFVLYGRRADSFKPDLENGFQSIHPEDAPRVIAAYEQFQHERKETFESEFRIIRADDDSVRSIRAMGTVFHDEAGVPIQLIGMNWDVTEERAREEKLAEALAQEKDLVSEAQAGERAKSEFLAMMSHEIRTPMNGVIGFAELLVNAPSLPSDCRNYAQTIVQSGEALLRILDEILDFIQLESGDIVIEKSAFSPRKMLQEVRAQTAPIAAEKQLRFLTLADEHLPQFLLGDAARLRQVLLNLVGNAIKFTESGSVTVGMWPVHGATDMFEFSVKDTGAGIAPVQMERIFRPFTQADSSTSRRHGGTGLGLTVCRLLVELLGGSMTVRSMPGVGSEFLIEMPLATVQRPAGDKEPALPLDATFATKHPLRVLLVEDDRVNLKLILALVRRLGYEPLAAQNGVEAVEIFLSEQPHCVFMDLQMPEMDGIEATTKIRAHERAAGRDGRTFIAALTANIFPAERRKCFNAGMNGYLNKPVKISSLAQTLIDACEFTLGSELSKAK